MKKLKHNAKPIDLYEPNNKLENLQTISIGNAEKINTEIIGIKTDVDTSEEKHCSEDSNLVKFATEQLDNSRTSNNYS